ncbi:MAG TPA: MMPL family transporter [Caulobacteraceae bacterium]|nr:MMPL family transporter [Caulobacteraceae bacterium]
MTAAAPRAPAIARLVGAVAGRPWLVAFAGLALALASALFVAGHFSLNTNTDDLLSPKLPYRQAEAAFARLFPSSDTQIVVVIDGATPELAEEAAQKLSDKLAADPTHFTSVRRPDGGDFWAKEGLLFAPTADVKSNMDRLIAAEPFLGPMAADPSLRGLMSSLGTALQGVGAGQASLSSLQAPMTKLADALEALEAGKPAFFSWRALVGGGKVDKRELRKILLVNPKLDYAQLEPGAEASDAIRADARTLALDAAHGATVRLTGPTPLEDEEFGSLAERALPITVVAIAAIILMLWLAVRSAKVIAAILVTTFAGLVAAAAMGLLIYRTFNVISIAFIPLFVGLGIDFGIQLSVRYRSEHEPGVTTRQALQLAALAMGRPITLAAFAIAAGFLAFAPTDYYGVSQLGVIAGAGMIIALVLNLTLLPALIALLSPPAAHLEPPPEGVSRIDTFVLGRRRRVLAGFVIAAAACAALLPLLRFDFNPIHLRDPKTESVSTLLALMADADSSPDTLEVVRPNLAAAQALAARLATLPQVAGARTLADFVPTEQPAKLAIISDANNLLGIALNPLVASPPPSDAELVQSLSATAASLRGVAGGPDPAAAQARRLAAALERLAQGSPQQRAQAQTALMTPFATLLTQIQFTLAAEPVTLQTLPADLVADWTTPDGRARVSVTPKGDANDNVVLGRFIDAVAKVAPDATGTPIGIREGGRVVVAAFLEAGALSFVAITALLFLVLRRVRDVAITMAPIVLTGLLTLGSCVLINQPLNFANIIALPLLFGIGVAFHIYFVMSWRAGGSHLLTSSLARAVFFSALTTATGFGSLWLSSHPGTASMGKLLMISLVWTLVSALIFQPALMGQPRAAKATA